MDYPVIVEIPGTGLAVAVIPLDRRHDRVPAESREMPDGTVVTPFMSVIDVEQAELTSRGYKMDRTAITKDYQWSIDIWERVED